MTDKTEAMRLADLLDHGAGDWECPKRAASLLRSQAERIDQLAAEVEALRAISFETVIQHLAATLPDDGSSITIYVEHWAGSVTATDWDGNEMPDPDCETVLGKVQEAAKWLNDQQSKLVAIDSARKE